MPYCKKCGAELPEYAVFCSKCGLKYPVSGAVDDGDYTAPPQPIQTVEEQTQIEQNNEPAPAPATQPAAPLTQSEKPTPVVNSEWFKNNSMALYIILGVVAIVLQQFCSQIAFYSFGFGVVLGVFGILCAVAFCVVGVVRYSINGKATGKKHTTCDNVCLALGIICLVYVLFMTIFVLGAADSLSSLSGLFR
ncbi:MAG: zinc ribbon domain-containing protein [Clostridiales bacterium]|nr:zinc ribbon domain-containing protein [Clostridiales bacterium]